MLDLNLLRDAHRQGHLRQAVAHTLRTQKVTIAQLDPNGICNAGCWFCPVKYEGNPTEYINQLLPEQVDRILTQIRSSSVVDQQKFHFLYTAHYNEVLLYKYYPEMLDLFKKHRLTTMVLTNGTTLTPKQTDLINSNRSVVLDVCMNIPAVEEADWHLKAGMNKNIHKTLIRNLRYFHDHSTIPGHVLINCNTERSPDAALEGGIRTTYQEAMQISEGFRKQFPRFKVTLNEHLVDRAGSLAVVNVFRNNRKDATKQVYACGHDRHMGSRIFAWLHINALGELFLCCDDYKMQYKFGSLLEHTLDELWYSDAHVDVICKAFGEICTGCVHAIRGDAGP